MKQGDWLLGRWLLVGIVGGLLSGLLLPLLPEAGVFGVAVSSIFLAAAVVGYAVKHGIIAAREVPRNDETPRPDRSPDGA